jgi:hypothetical protein
MIHGGPFNGLKLVLINLSATGVATAAPMAIFRGSAYARTENLARYPGSTQAAIKTLNNK